MAEVCLGGWCCAHRIAGFFARAGEVGVGNFEEYSRVLIGSYDEACAKETLAYTFADEFMDEAHLDFIEALGEDFFGEFDRAGGLGGEGPRLLQRHRQRLARRRTKSTSPIRSPSGAPITS